MADRGAQIGNKNALKAKLWLEALKRALGAEGGTIGEGLDKIATKLIKFAMEGQPWAIEHLADRLDGKPRQTIDGKLEVEHTVVTGNADSLAERVRQKARERTSQPTVQ